MATVFKKKRFETLRKVNVKSACVCSSSLYACDCTCYAHTPRANASQIPEAQVCANLYYRNYYYYGDQ